jgi:hypothetical protein
VWHEINTVEQRIETARHFRLSPGGGVHGDDLAELVMRLSALGDHPSTPLPWRRRLRPVA